MLASAPRDSKSAPRIVPALIAMSALQALVACAIFAPGVMAPRIGIAPATLGAYATAACVVAFFFTFAGGQFAGRYGSFRVASFCAVIVFATMGIAAWSGASPWLAIAGVVLGLAYGPETPASSTILFRITPPAKRPLVFSLRQTGNQSGGIIGSLALPYLAAIDPLYGYVAIMLLALLALGAFELLRPRYDPLVRGTGSGVALRDALRILATNAAMRKLAIASLPFSALQIALNVFLVSYGVTQLGLDLVQAGLLLATAQAGGLVGRLSFGLIASRFLPAWTTVVALGFGMSLCAGVVALATPGWSWALLLAVAFLFGVTASGWNGVFLAEVARLSPEGRVGEATGAVLMFGFAGLVVGPLLMAGIAASSSLSVAYAALGLMTLLATLVLIRAPVKDSPPA
ncbi:MAG: MFS transporter [Alphaproteobacteria bacterium]|nr:MFS transporter [Alphaproteobacteria bacterium]